MMIDTIVYCLKGATAMDCLNCPYFANRDGGIIYCRGKRLFEAIKIIEKYQKIEKIYETWLTDGRMDTHKAISKIGEVLCEDRIEEE